MRHVLDAARALKERLTTETEAAIDVALSAGSADDDAAPDARGDGGAGRARARALRRRRCGGRSRTPASSRGKLSGVILVGGATRMPLVRRFVEELFGQKPLADIDPDQVVALGAAIQADMLAGGAGHDDVLLLDVVPLSLGLETMGGVVEKLIHRNTTVPCGATQTFTTFADKQTGFDLHVVQGEREMVGECRSLARFTLKGIPPMPAGMARLEVTFLVDADGILRVSAREETTGQEAAIEVKPSYGLTDEEVERMLLDSFAHAEDDVKARLLAEQRVEADGIVAAARAAMADAPELLETGEREAIDGALARRRGRARGQRPPRDPRRDRGARPRVEGVRDAPDEPRARAGVPRARDVDAVGRRETAHEGRGTEVARAQGQVRAGRDRDRGAGRDQHPRGVEQGARAGRLRVRRRLRLLDLPRLREAGARRSVGRVRSRRGHHGQGVRREGELAPRLPVEDRDATRPSSSRSAARAARRSSTSTPRSAPR